LFRELARPFHHCPFRSGRFEAGKRQSDRGNKAGIPWKIGAEDRLNADEGGGQTLRLR